MNEFSLAFTAAGYAMPVFAVALCAPHNRRCLHWVSGTLAILAFHVGVAAWWSILAIAVAGLIVEWYWRTLAKDD